MIMLLVLINHASKGNGRRAAWGLLAWIAGALFLATLALSTSDGFFYFG